MIALCAGEPLASYAEVTGSRLNTGKSHLRRLFDKTGFRRVSADIALRLGL